MLNQARLRVLKVREDHVRNVLEEARKHLGEVTSNQAKYAEIIKTLILQGLYQLFETNVNIRCRPQDRELVESVFGDVCSSYKEAVGKEVNLKIDGENPLPPGSTGGVELTAQKAKIKVNNSLEARLELIAQQLVPQIRTALFGRNVNRKFTD